jgi:hypothetical protein
MLAFSEGTYPALGLIGGRAALSVLLVSIGFTGYLGSRPASIDSRLGYLLTLVGLAYFMARGSYWSLPSDIFPFLLAGAASVLLVGMSARLRQSPETGHRVEALDLFARMRRVFAISLAVFAVAIFVYIIGMPVTEAGTPWLGLGASLTTLLALGLLSRIPLSRLRYGILVFLIYWLVLLAMNLALDLLFLFPFSPGAYDPIYSVLRICSVLRNIPVIGILLSSLYLLRGMSFGGNSNRPSASIERDRVSAP